MQGVFKGVVAGMFWEKLERAAKKADKSENVNNMGAAAAQEGPDPLVAIADPYGDVVLDVRDRAVVSTSDLVDARLMPKAGNRQSQPYAAILLDSGYSYGIASNPQSKLDHLRKFLLKHSALRGKPGLVKQAFGDVLFYDAAVEPSSGNLIGGEPSELWLKTQSRGKSNRAIRTFGHCYAVLNFKNPERAPAVVLQWSTCRRYVRFVPHHSLETRWIYLADTTVEQDGVTMHLLDAFKAWYAPVHECPNMTMGKYIARYQLPFSATWDVGHAEIVIEPDVRSYVTGKKLADGAGRVSPGKADDVAEELKRQGVAVGEISAMQMRIAGCKGILLIDKLLPDTEKRVFLSESQVKVPSNPHRSLEIVLFVDNLQGRRGAFLNKELIPLLEDGFLRRGLSRGTPH